MSIRVVICDRLPVSVKGFTKKTMTEYIIVINDILDHQTRWETIMHELKHINLSHHDRYDTIECELEVARSLS